MKIVKAKRQDDKVTSQNVVVGEVYEGVQGTYFIGRHKDEKVLVHLSTGVVTTTDDWAQHRVTLTKIKGSFVEDAS